MRIKFLEKPINAIQSAWDKLIQKLPKKDLTPEQQQKRERRNAWIKEHRYLLLCMAIPALVMYLIYVARLIHPFGNGSVLVLDLNGQYVWFFEALRNAVWGDASLLYSFARALGGEFTGIYAYYLASPLSYIVCLFPQHRMLEALLTLFLLKTAICGGSFGYYMHRTLKDRKPMAIIVFSVFYALSAYAVVQQHNTMWIDAVMWLPMITLGIESLIKHGKYKMYTIFLAITLFSNFYIGYMICIYCFFYFFIYYFAHGEDHRNNPLQERFHFVKSLARIAFYSIIALGIAAIILLGAYYSLNFGKTTFSTTKWEFLINFDILDLLYKFLPGSYDTVRPEGLPFVYCGLLTLLLIPAYFLSKRYPMRQKIGSGILIFVFVAIASLNITDLIMHGFQAPNWLNYRYSFMLSFYLCVIACRAFVYFEEISLKGMMVTGGLIALLCVILQKYTNGEYIDPNDFTTIWFSLILIFVYLAALAIWRTTDKKRLVAVVLTVIVCAEAFLSGLFHLNALGADVGYSQYSYYNQFLSFTRPLVERVQERDKSFYRMEKTFHRSTNDNMALEMRGLSGSTSTLNKETILFLNKMGYASQSHWSQYRGGTPVNDSLLGLKYILSNKDVYANYYEIFDVDEASGYTTYYNPYALSIAYGVSDELLNYQLGYTGKTDKKENETSKNDSEDEDKPIEINQIGNIVDKIKEKLNEWFEIDETKTTSTYLDNQVSPFKRMNAIMGAMLGSKQSKEVFKPIPVEEDNVQLGNLKKANVFLHTRYEQMYPEMSGTLTYTINVPVSGEIYFYLPSMYPREVKLDLFDSAQGAKLIDYGKYFTHDTDCIISLGYHEAGTMISLDMTLQSQYFYVMNNQDCFFYIDYEVFEEVMGTLAKDQLIVTEHTEDEIHGTFTASNAHETVLTTLAFDKGWKIYVDGKEVEPIKALGSLIAFQIDGKAGQTHEISLIYKPNTYRIGLTVSLIFTGLLLIIIILERWMRKIPVLRAMVAAIPAPAPKKKVDQTAEENAPREEAPPDEVTPKEEPSPEEPTVEKTDKDDDQSTSE